MVENKRLKKEAEKWEQEKNNKDKEIETYRSMFEEAENKYVEAEKRLYKMNINGREKDKNEGNDGKQEKVDEKHTGYRNIKEERGMDFMEEPPQSRRDLDGERWPAIRPPILGKSHVLTLPGKTKTPMRTGTRGEESGSETSLKSGSLVRRTPLRNPLKKRGRPEKGEKRQISIMKENMDLIDRSKY